MKLAKRTGSISTPALRDRSRMGDLESQRTHAGCVDMRRPIAFSLLVSLVAPLGGGQFKAGEFPQGVGKATSGVEAVSSRADQPEPSTSGEIFPRTKKIFRWLIKSGAENGPVPRTQAVSIAASTSVASETTVDAGSSPVGDWLSGTSRPGMPRPGMPGSVTTSTRSPRVDSPVRRAQAAPVNPNCRWVRALLLQCPLQACRVMSYPQS